MAYLEANFKTELVAAFEREGCLCHKFPDLARGIKKPHDLVACVDGRFCAIETKLKKTGTASRPGRWFDGMIVLTHAHLTLLQRLALEKTEKAMGDTFVIVGVYDLYDHRRMAFALSYSDFQRLPEWTLRDLQRDAIEMPWERGKGWDLQALLDEIIV